MVEVVLYFRSQFVSKISGSALEDSSPRLRAERPEGTLWKEAEGR